MSLEKSLSGTVLKKYAKTVWKEEVSVKQKMLPFSSDICRLLKEEKFMFSDMAPRQVHTLLLRVFLHLILALLLCLIWSYVYHSLLLSQMKETAALLSSQMLILLQNGFLKPTVFS